MHRLLIAAQVLEGVVELLATHHPLELLGPLPRRLEVVLGRPGSGLRLLQALAASVQPLLGDAQHLLQLWLLLGQRLGGLGLGPALLCDHAEVLLSLLGATPGLDGLRLRRPHLLLRERELAADRRDLLLRERGPFGGRDRIATVGLGPLVGEPDALLQVGHRVRGDPPPFLRRRELVGRQSGALGGVVQPLDRVRQRPLRRERAIGDALRVGLDGVRSLLRHRRVPFRIARAMLRVP
jgi:hypothetical protein